MGNNQLRHQVLLIFIVSVLGAYGMLKRLSVRERGRDFDYLSYTAMRDMC